MGPAKTRKLSDLPPVLQGADFMGRVALSCETFGRHASHPARQIDPLDFELEQPEPQRWKEGDTDASCRPAAAPLPRRHFVFAPVGRLLGQLRALSGDEK